MGFWDKLFGEFVDIIEWTDDSADTMVYRFERYGNEIKYGAALTVRESQVAVLVNEGKIADVFQPGMYKLETKNIPVLSTLQGWPHGFESPFKAEVYFFNTKRFVDLKWGTKNPIMLRDKEFSAVRLRAFGTYEIRILDAVAFLREVVGTDGHFTTNEITNQLRNLIVSRFANVLGESEVPILDLAANYDDLSTYITAKIGPEFKEYGIAVTRMLVENISLPPEVEKALDKRTSMGVIGGLRDYADFQAAEAMTQAASNPGGGASDGVGLGMGIAIASKMSESLGAAGSGTPGGPPRIPTEARYYLAINGHQTGPFSRSELRTKIADGDLTRDSLIWTHGMQDWQTADQADGVKALFADSPPPLPKS
ncbi:MAG: SPFH domain-containing protein [Gammaproteobacteria bacterium]|nr:SPFH domain-containing protein [Gammaproteobacteria bacterium]